MRKGNLTYKISGVDSDKKDKLSEQILEKIYRNFKGKILNIPWGFAGFYKYSKNLLICGSCDGVGTKIRIASLLDMYDTVGEDLVAMNVNDLVVHNVKPIFFLDYIAFDKLDKKRVQRIISGILRGCEKAGVVLLGGETAIMPSFYTKNSCEIVGSAVGITRKDKVIYGKYIKEGDIVIGLESSGLHSNGFSLVRKVIFNGNENRDILLHTKIDGEVLGEILLTPTRIYVRTFLKLTERFKSNSVIRGAAHITGGGLEGNLSRIIPDGLSAVINCKTWPKYKIFEFLQKKGNIPWQEMYKTFNMGIGFVIVVNKNYFSAVERFLREKLTTKFHIIGTIEKAKNRNKVKLIY